jgi:hypothetical protein
MNIMPQGREREGAYGVDDLILLGDLVDHALA